MPNLQVYPTIFPIIEIKKIVEIIRGGQVSENIAELAHAIWVVQGYAQGMILGDASPLSAPVDVENFDAVATLEKMADEGATAQMAVPWELIIKWALGYLAKLIEEKLRG